MSPLCEICRSNPSIGGEGREICAACLLRLADAAARPEKLSELEQLLLSEAHGDAVELGVGLELEITLLPGGVTMMRFVDAGVRIWKPKLGGPLV